MTRFQLLNWLQVLAFTKLPEIDERKSDQFEPKMMTLCGLKAQQQALEFILPGKRAFHDEAQFVEGGLKAALTTPFGRLPITGILRDIGLEPRSEDTLALGFAVTARGQIAPGPASLKPCFAGDVVEGFAPLGQQHHVHRIDGGPRQGRQDRARVLDQGNPFLPLLVVVAARANRVPPFVATVVEPAPGSQERSRV